MYVCICNAITDSDVRTLVDQGCQSVSQVYRGLGWQPQCCKCTDEIRRIVKGAPADALADTSFGD